MKDETEPRTLRSLVRPVLWLALVALVIVGALWLLAPYADDLHRWIESFGLLAPVVFVVVAALLMLTPVPKSLLVFAAGVAFGLWIGAVASFVATILAAETGFWIGRRLGRQTVERFTGARAAKLDALMTARGVVSVITVRLVPVVPFWALNYLAALTAVRRRDYFLGTLIGVVPGTIVFTAIGALGFGLG